MCNRYSFRWCFCCITTSFELCRCDRLCYDSCGRIILGNLCIFGKFWLFIISGIRRCCFSFRVVLISFPHLISSFFLHFEHTTGIAHLICNVSLGRNLHLSLISSEVSFSISHRHLNCRNHHHHRLWEVTTSFRVLALLIINLNHRHRLLHHLSFS